MLSPVDKVPDYQNKFQNNYKLISFATIKIVLVCKHYINTIALSTNLENGNNEEVQTRIKLIPSAFLHC